MIILKNWLLGKYDKLNYLLSALLIALSLANMYFFIVYILFVIIATVANKNFNTILMFYIFAIVFRSLLYYGIYRLLIIYLLLALIIKCGIKIYERHIKVSAVTIVIAALYVIYIFWDFGYRENSLYYCLIEALDILAIIFCFYNRDEFDFVSLSLTFVVMFILCNVYSIFAIEPYAEPILIDNIAARFLGVSMHPNVTAELCMLSLALLFTLKFYDKISDYTFGILFSALYPIGLLTLSRIFLLFCGVVFYVFYAAMVIKKSHGGVAYQFMLWFAALVLLLTCLFQREFFVTVFRKSYEQSAFTKLEQLDDLDFLTSVVEGEVSFDPGRLGIWVLYLRAIFGSFKTALLGYGADAPWIGKMHSHNILIFYIYRFGFIGFAALASIFILLFVQLKKENLMAFIKDNIGIIFIVLAFYIYALLNNNELFILPYCMFFIFFGSKMHTTANLQNFANRIKVRKLENGLFMRKN